MHDTPFMGGLTKWVITPQNKKTTKYVTLLTYFCQHANMTSTQQSREEDTPQHANARENKYSTIILQHK